MPRITGSPVRIRLPFHLAGISYAAVSASALTAAFLFICTTTAKIADATRSTMGAIVTAAPVYSPSAGKTIQVKTEQNAIDRDGGST